MEWITVISLLLFGLILLVLEFIFIPGTTIVGLVGFVSMSMGVYLGYDYFGSAIGTGILVGSLSVTGATFYFALKSGFWERFALRKTITARVQEEDLPVHVGEEGIAISTLRPMGTAEFGARYIEVRTNGDFIRPGSKVRVIKTDGPRVWVENLEPETDTPSGSVTTQDSLI